MTQAPFGAYDSAQRSVQGERPPPIVLVPLDGSPTSAAAIPVARTFAEILGGTIHLLHVSDETPSPQAVLDKLGLGPESVHGLVVSAASGRPADAIVAFADAHDSTLIAMATQGWTARSGVSLGSVAWAVLGQTARPLLFVRPDVGAQWTSRGSRLSRILVPLDGTPRTANALAPAAELAQRSGATVDVLHVVVPGQSGPDEPGSMTVPQYTDQPHYAWAAWQREFIHRFCDCFAGSPEGFLVAVGDPGEEVLRVARERQSDLVVLAWKGELDGERARTVRSVLSEAMCPVLCLRTELDLRGAASAGASSVRSSA